MKRRSVAFTALSIVAGIVLLIILVRVSHVNIRESLARLRSVDQVAFAWLALLMGINTYLSSYKWRLIDGVLREKSDASPSRAIAFAVTSLGIALGQVLPVQVSVSVARTIGTWGVGRAIRRGTIGTLFEQGFDFLIVCFLSIASLATYFLHGGPAMWFVFAAAMIVTALGSVGAGIRALSNTAARVAVNDASPKRWKRTIAGLSESGLLNVKLGHRLILISAVRFFVLVLMAGQTTKAIHSTLPLWHMAVAMPFVVLSASLGITPGGLGLTEFTYATILTLFGTPLSLTTEWALANRLLTIAAALIVACGGGILLLCKAPARLRNARLARALRT